MLGESAIKMADVKKIYQANEQQPQAAVHTDQANTGGAQLAAPTLKEVMADE